MRTNDPGVHNTSSQVTSERVTRQLIDSERTAWYTRIMRLRAFIPLLLVLISCLSSTASAGGTCHGQGAHVHIHLHGGSVHEHAHRDHSQNEPHAPTLPCSDEDESDHHHHCCRDHEHHRDLIGSVSISRARDLPTFCIGIISKPSDAFLLPTCEVQLRWAPLRERPPDFLAALRTCVMLN
jgi:hypothetical protein